MATLELITNDANPAAEDWEREYIERMAAAVLRLLPESPERAGRVLQRAQEMHSEIAARGPTAMAEAMMRLPE
jgi:hypothetical protein